MVLLPTPLKAFTDVMPEVKSLLRACASNLYGWRCEHADLDETSDELWQATESADYPSSWPTPKRVCLPPGTMPFSSTVKRYADRRLDRIRSDLATAGPYYPADDVRSVLQYWRIRFD